ncbi:MAG: transcription termination/antitermination NusG family protein [Armatimonadota bacterium]|nr:transcription termination/antitermination NusG family protein [Armatimonadota bacterium]
MSERLSRWEQHSRPPAHQPDDGRAWYVLHTKPREEPRVIAHLERRAPLVDVFLPLIEVVRRHARRTTTGLEPLFPGYLFLRTALTPATWSAVHWAPGARGILTSGERPAEVPQELIDAIAARIEPLGFIRVGLPYGPGTRVRIRTGPFAGLEGIFERPTSRRYRVRVLLEVLGRVTPLEVDVFDLEAV